MTSPIGTIPTVPPAVRTPAQDSSVQELITSINALIALLGSPAQQGTLESLLTQIISSGAQPFVPNMKSASLLEQGPGLYTMAAPATAFRIWGGYVTFGITTNGTYTGSDRPYAKVFADMGTASPPGGGSSNPQFIVAHVELAVSTANAADSGSTPATLPGAPMPAGSSLKMDVNGGNILSGGNGIEKASGNIFYSVP